MLKNSTIAGLATACALTATAFAAPATATTPTSDITLTVGDTTNIYTSNLLGYFGPAENPVMVTYSWYHDMGGPGSPGRRVTGMNLLRKVDGQWQKLDYHYCDYGFHEDVRATSVTDSDGAVWIKHGKCRTVKVNPDNTVEYPKTGSTYSSMVGVGPHQQVPQFVSTVRNDDDTFALEISQWRDGEIVVIDKVPVPEDIYTSSTDFLSYETDGNGNSTIVARLSVRNSKNRFHTPIREYRQIDGVWQEPAVLDGRNNHTTRTAIGATAYSPTGGIAFRTVSVGVSKLKLHTGQCRYSGDLAALGRCQLPDRNPVAAAALGPHNTVLTVTQGAEPKSLTVRACDVDFTQCTTHVVKGITSSNFTDVHVTGSTAEATHFVLSAGQQEGEVAHLVDLSITRK